MGNVQPWSRVTLPQHLLVLTFLLLHLLSSHPLACPSSGQSLDLRTALVSLLLFVDLLFNTSSLLPLSCLHLAPHTHPGFCHFPGPSFTHFSILSPQGLAKPSLLPPLPLVSSLSTLSPQLPPTTSFSSHPTSFPLPYLLASNVTCSQG